MSHNGDMEATTKLANTINRAKLANPTADATGTPVRTSATIINNNKVTVRVGGFNSETVKFTVERVGGHTTPGLTQAEALKAIA